MNEKIIDLTKPQIISGDLKVLVRDSTVPAWTERYLLSIYTKDGDIWYRCWNDGKTGEELRFNPSFTMPWKQCKHIPNKRNMTRREIIGFLLHKKEPFLICFEVGENFDFDDFRNYSAPTMFDFSGSVVFYYREINEKGEFISEPIPLTTEEELKNV